MDQDIYSENISFVIYFIFTNLYISMWCFIELQISVYLVLIKSSILGSNQIKFTNILSNPTSFLLSFFGYSQTFIFFQQD